MGLELRWIVRLPASALHVAQTLIEHREQADAKLGESIAEATRGLAAAIEGCGPRGGQLLGHLVPLSAGISQPRELAQVALRKVVPADQAQSCLTALAEAIRQVMMAFQRAAPDLLEQLELRAQPLRAQWEARGPGLAAELARLVEPEIVASQADVVLVQPVRGGFGRACLGYNTVVIEALLTDSNPQLPEVLRLGWLLAQLQCDLGKFQGSLAGDRLARAAALAMVPAVLAAAEEVELARCDPPTIKLALQTWRPVDNAEQIEAAQLLDWWTTYASARPKWSVALGGLDKMLGAPSDPTAHSLKMPAPNPSC